MICTASGSVPIEQIQPGDWVYSAHERTGELSLRPVMELYRNVVPEIWTVAYDHDHDPATADATLDCTPGHPFWSEDAQAFVSASDLSAGSRVRLITGESARVSAVHPRRGPPTSRGTTVYNFAVAEHHTYFAEAGGVWVHNDCAELVEDILLLHKAFLDQVADPDLAVKKALEALKPDTYKSRQLTNPNRTQAGSALYEQSPRVIAGALDDVQVAKRFIEETGLPSNKPVSIARGETGGPRLGTPTSTSPESWNKLSDDLIAELRAISTPPDRPGYLQSQLISVAHHCEVKSILRLREAGALGRRATISTAGKKVCGGCFDPDGGGGLGQLMRHLQIEEPTLRSELGFELHPAATEVKLVMDAVLNEIRVIFQ